MVTKKKRFFLGLTAAVAWFGRTAWTAVLLAGRTVLGLVRFFWRLTWSLKALASVSARHHCAVAVVATEGCGYQSVERASYHGCRGSVAT